MLNFLDPLSVEGLTLFRDDVDPRTFYVLPDVPGVPVDADGLPEFLFLLYLRDASEVKDGEAAGAGYLQFRTVLTLPKDREEKLLAELRTQLSAEQAAGTKPFGNEITLTEPLLAQPLWTSGSVDLSTFAVGESGLVTQATSKSPVDLTGDLGASFTASLSADGAGVFRGAFDAYRLGTHQMPLVITYNLTYAGRISATLHIEAKHSVIHERVWQRARPWRLMTEGYVRYVPLVLEQPFTVDLLGDLRQQFGMVRALVSRVDFGQAVTETIADNSITVDILEASTGDATADAATRATLLKLATDLLTEALMPSLTSGAPVPGASDANQGTSTTSLMQLDESATPGTSTFTLDLNDAMSVVRTASPNAPLQVLIGDPKALSACFQELRLADDFFKEMKVAVSTSGVDFSTSGIAKIHVHYRYCQTDDADPAKPVVDRHDDGILAAATDTLAFRFDTAREADGGHKTRYEYMAEVYWQKGGPPTQVPWTWCDSQSLIITPPLLGAVKVDAVMTAPPGSVDSARVELSYTSTDGTAYTGALELTPAAPRASWLQPTGEIIAGAAPTAPSYSYRTVYRIGDVEIAQPQHQASQETIEVPTPFDGVVVFSLVAQGSADTVQGIVGTLTYTDDAHGYTQVRTISLTPGAAPVDERFPLIAGGPRTASLTARVQHKDGTHEDLPPTTLNEGISFVGADPLAALSVQLHTDLLDFTQDVKAVHVTLTYRHADGTTTTAEPMFTAVAHEVFTWSVPRAPGDPADYDADVTFYGVDRTKDQTLHLTHLTSTNVELDRSMAVS